MTIEAARTIGRSPADPKRRDWERGDGNHYWRDNRAANHSQDSDTQRERTGLTGGHLLDPSQRHDSCMKHASCGLQNQEGSHSQRDSLAACLGSNTRDRSGDSNHVQGHVMYTGVSGHVIDQVTWLRDRSGDLVT